MAQVAGRAGRRDEQGMVIIQTRQPDAPVLEMVSRNDYTGFFNWQMLERSAFNYPPYTRLVSVTVKGTDMRAVENTAMSIAACLAKLFGQDRVLGPDAPPVSKVMYSHIRRIMIKARLEQTSTAIREKISQAVSSTARETGLSGVTVSFDADPQ